jgi:hypothetical protein
MACATDRASRFVDRAVFLAASRAPVFTVTRAPVHTIDRARFDRATRHASSPAAFKANDLTRMVQLYPPARLAQHARDPVMAVSDAGGASEGLENVCRPTLTGMRMGANFSEEG